MKKQDQKQISSCAKYIESLSSSMLTFATQIEYFRYNIKHGEEALPRLKKEIIDIEKGLPFWRDELRRYKLSINTHRKKLLEQQKLLDLLKQKAKLTTRIKALDIVSE